MASTFIMASVRCTVVLMLFFLYCSTFIADDMELCDGKKGQVICTCGYSTVRVTVPYCRVKGGTQCSPCDEKQTIKDICSKYEKCLMCDCRTGTCKLCLEGRTGPYCEERIPGYETSLKRNRRNDENHCCGPPTLETYDLFCTFTDSCNSECQGKCIWGHKMRGTNLRHFNCTCIDGKPKWHPFEPEDCKPFVNCALDFSKLADEESRISVVSNYADSPVKATLKCRNWNWSVHFCTLGGQWFPSLPPCIEKDEAEGKTTVSGSGGEGCCC